MRRAVLLASLLVLAACGETREAGAPTTITTTTAPAEREVVTYEVDGLAREAIVDAAPSELTARPLVFVFHGHGGSGANAERSFPIHDLWPDAIVVFPSGLPGVPGITDPEGTRPGWQKSLGEVGDRDLHFFDAVLDDLVARYPVDVDRVYAMGHSNGSRFAALLWDQRPGTFAAVANSSAQAGPFLATAEPVPLFMSMGEADPLVPFAAQQRSIEPARRRLGIDPATAVTDGYLTTARGDGDLELATYVHPGGHEMPDEVLDLIVAFFQRHPAA